MGEEKHSVLLLAVHPRAAAAESCPYNQQCPFVVRIFQLLKRPLFFQLPKREASVIKLSKLKQFLVDLKLFALVRDQ